MITLITMIFRKEVQGYMVECYSAPRTLYLRLLLEVIMLISYERGMFLEIMNNVIAKRRYGRQVLTHISI